MEYMLVSVTYRTLSLKQADGSPNEEPDNTGVDG